ncbi:MAG: histidine phosphatase family protein [Erysipelotrichia bacterium]|nr:histidine phosphatase family protein [Erysipelotrichia bacterium]
MKHITFYMVRHGETQFNISGRMQGTCDSPLTRKGIQDGEAASIALREIPFTRAYTSTSERARDTAELICMRHNVILHETKGLKEFDFGLLDGEIAVDHIDEIKRRKIDDSFDEIGGENIEMINARIDRTFERILDECRDGDIVLIVTHGLYILHVLQHLLDVDTKAYRTGFAKPGKFIVPNGGITKFAYDSGSYRMISFPAAPKDFKDIRGTE